MLNIPEGELKKIQSFLVEKISPYFIFVFGSSVSGNFSVDSDIDLAYYSKDKIGLYDMFIIKEELADLLCREIDLINLRNASTVFKTQIVGTGIVFYCADRNRLDEFRIRTFKEYALLNEERQNILNKVKEEGAIYGKWCRYEQSSNYWEVYNKD